MKIIGSLALALALCRLCSAQAGFSASMTGSSGIRISLESSLEPEKPALPGSYQMGVFGSDSRYAANSTTHEYFGYTIQVRALANHPEMYRVVLGALRRTAKELQLPDPARWTMLPPPAFPEPQIVSSSDTIVLDVFENAATGQRIVDRIHVGLDTCGDTSTKANEISCLKNMLADAKRALGDKLKQIQSSGDTAKVAAVLDSQQSWEKYRDDACGGLAGEIKRLQCELKLTRSRTQDLGEIY